MDNIKNFEDFLDRMQGLLDNAKKQGHIIVRIEDLENAFPELKESKGSENENIRKDIVAAVETYGDFTQGRKEEIYTWLEKQCKKKLVEKYNITGIKSKHAEGKLGEMIKEMKSADKVEPKFHEGEWITDGNITIQIEAIKNDCYLYSGDCALYSTKIVDKVYHLWTIQDAKDGDVLVCPKYAGDIIPNIFIFKDIKIKDNDVFCYCSFLDIFRTEGYVANTDPINTDFYPATKKQRDILFQKMKEAGYEWDAYNKELKKVEQKPAESRQETKINGGIVCEDFNEGDGYYKVNLAYLSKSQVELIENLVASWQKLTNNTAEWSEEDELQMQGIIDLLHGLTNRHNWLKSIKDRYTWKPTEKQVKALEHFVRSVGESGYASPYDNDTKLIYSLLEQLKQL